MNDKNIKKQPSAQALNDDALENVAGGFQLWYDLSSKNMILYPNYQERNWLESQGYRAPNDTYRNGIEYMIDSNGNQISSKKIIGLLEQNGFSQAGQWGKPSYRK